MYKIRIHNVYIHISYVVVYVYTDYISVTSCEGFLNELYISKAAGKKIMRE